MSENRASRATVAARGLTIVRMLAVAGFVAVAAVQAADFMSVLALAGIWGVATVGLGLVLGAAGQISLCQASFVLIGAYGYGIATLEHGQSSITGIACGIIGGGLAAIATSPILRARGYYLALATIAVALLVTQIGTSAGWLPGGRAGLIGVPPMTFGGITLFEASDYVILSSCLLTAILAVLHWAYGRGKRRRAIELLHHDEDLIASFGGNASRLKLAVFVVGGLLAGLSGALYAGYFGFVSVNGFSVLESFALAIAVFIGGGGRLLGALAGILVYQCSFAVLGADGSPYRFALLGAVVILTAHFFPQGLLPTKRELAALAPQRFTRPARRLVERGEHSPAKNAGEGINGWGERHAVTPGELTIVGVTKRFGAMTAVDSVSLTIQPGSVTALIGPNGAGKTTLLDIVAGDQRPTEGRIVLNGEDVTSSGSALRARSGIGRTYQKLRLVPTMTCLDVVLVGVDLAARRETAVSESDRRSRAHDALRLVGLETHASITCGALTFGQRRLLEMARAMATQPRLLLLDEPSSGLDDSEVPDFAELIRRVNENGCTVILVEHNLPFVQSVAADVIALDRGRLLAHGSAADVFALPEFRRSYLGELVES